VEGAAMSARGDILDAIRAQRVRSTARPAQYQPSPLPGDLIESFTRRASAIDAEVRILNSAAEIPAAVADLLRAKNMAAEIHLAPGASAPDMPSLTVTHALPGPDDAALTAAPLAIAETGTLAYTAAEPNPASWHFRAGFEIAVLRAADILPHMENVLARIKAKGALPHTINFVTGPSRTGDIEQTLELGAHGPKALAILIIRE
jgi:L-lactate dehydrogenase complex protein LldG